MTQYNPGRIPELRGTDVNAWAAQFTRQVRHELTVISKLLKEAPATTITETINTVSSGGSSSSSVSSHDILSTTHPDTLVEPIVRGDLLVVNSSSLWSRFGVGAAGYWLSSSGTDPAWTAPAALTKVNDTNVTLTLGGTPATALLQAVSLTLGWTGTLADGRIASSAYWNSKQDGHANLTSLSALSYVSLAFVKMSAAGTFTLDTNTYLTSVTAHNILSATHGDTLADTVVRGDIIYGNATPKWARLPIGANTYVLTSDGTDVSWQPPPGGGSPHALLSATHSDTVVNAVSRGSLIYGNSTPAWDELLIGAANTVLHSNGTDAAWAALADADIPNTLTLTAISNLTTNGFVKTSGGVGTLSVDTNTYLTTVTAHDILSATHSDTLASAVVRGSIIVGNSTPKWSRLAIGAAATVLHSDGTDAAWAALVDADIPNTLTITAISNLTTNGFVKTSGGVGTLSVDTSTYLTSVTAHDILSATHSDTLAAAVVRGSLIVGNATPKWSRLVIGAANRVLRSDGTDAAWAQVALATDVSGTLPATNIEKANLAGTANQVILSASGTGVLVGSTNITLSTPQDIATTSTVRFGKVGINMAATYELDITGTSGALYAARITSTGSTTDNTRGLLVSHSVVTGASLPVSIYGELLTTSTSSADFGQSAGWFETINSSASSSDTQTIGLVARVVKSGTQAHTGYMRAILGSVVTSSTGTATISETHGLYSQLYMQNIGTVNAHNGVTIDIDGSANGTILVFKGINLIKSRAGIVIDPTATAYTLWCAQTDWKMYHAGDIYGPAGTTSMTTGFVRMPSAAGIPSGAPEALTGRLATYYNSTNDQVFLYNTVWASVGAIIAESPQSLPKSVTIPTGYARMTSGSLEITGSLALTIEGTARMDIH